MHSNKSDGLCTFASTFNMSGQQICLELKTISKNLLNKMLQQFLAIRIKKVLARNSGWVKEGQLKGTNFPNIAKVAMNLPETAKSLLARIANNYHKNNKFRQWQRTNIFCLIYTAVNILRWLKSHGMCMSSPTYPADQHCIVQNKNWWSQVF